LVETLGDRQVKDKVKLGVDLSKGERLRSTILSIQTLSWSPFGDLRLRYPSTSLRFSFKRFIHADLPDLFIEHHHHIQLFTPVEHRQLTLLHPQS
jgi:hypothetical protein